MTTRKVLTVFLALVIAASFVWAAGEPEELEYPTRPIRFVVPWAPGGSSDAIARVFSSIAPEYLGVDLEVVNRDGAGGTIATTEVRGARPDGYTIQLNAIGVMATQPALRDVPYNIDDFDYVTGLSYEPIVMLTHTNSPFETFDDLKDAGRTIMMGANAPGSLPYIAAVDIMHQAGIDAEPVPMTGGGPSLTALLGEHVDIAMVHPNEAVEHVENGDLRFIGIASRERNVMFPDIITFKEMGIDVEYSVWKWIQTPTGVDPEILAFLEEKFAEMLQAPEMIEFAERTQLELLDLPGEEIRDMLHQQAADIGAAIEAIDIDL